MRRGTPERDDVAGQRSAAPPDGPWRVLPDGGEAPGDERGDDDETPDGDMPASDGPTDEADEEDGSDTVDRSNVEVRPAGEAEPADPRWEPPDLDDIPEVEGPTTRPADGSTGERASSGREFTAGGAGEDPTAGMPNTARAPGATRVSESGTDGFVVALELCARLPDDARLPEEAADLVPVALEAELEQDVQAFAAQEFDNPSPHVEMLEFVEVDDELWLRLRLGVPREAFTDLDPEAIREHALQGLDSLL